MSSDKITAVMILEILGRPAKHLVETLEKLIESIGNEKGVEVLNKKIKEPIELKENKNFYSSFAEVEIQVESLDYIAMLMFKYTPANVQILEPEKITIDNNLLSEIFSELVRKLHAYDEVARVIQMDNQKMRQQLAQLIKENKIKPEDIKKQKKTSKKKSKK